MSGSAAERLPNEESIAAVLERGVRVFELLAAAFLVVLFGIGVFDFGLRILRLGTSGRITQPRAVVGLIDTALLLFIIVEVFLTVIAYARDEPVARIVVAAGLIAITRTVITHRIGTYSSVQQALLAAIAYGSLLAILVGAFYVIRRQERDTAGEGTLV